MIEKMFVHWSATPYTWLGNDYHTCVNMAHSDLFPGHIQNEDPDFPGVWVHRITPYKTELHGHTYGRNSKSCSIAVACMGRDPVTGKEGFEAYPPTEGLIEVMCKEIAKVAVGLKWEPKVGSLEHKIMTHAEAAGLRDYPLELVKKAPAKDNDVKARTLSLHGVYLPHDNYGPNHWKGAPVDPEWPGGTWDKWDLWQLSSKAPGGSGGYIIRDKVIKWMKKIS